MTCSQKCQSPERTRSTVTLEPGLIAARIEHMSSIHVFSGPRSKIHEALNFVKSSIIARRSDLKTNKITLRHVRINLNFKMVRVNIYTQLKNIFSCSDDNSLYLDLCFTYVKCSPLLLLEAKRRYLP